MNHDLATHYLGNASKEFLRLKKLAEGALLQIEDETFYGRVNEESNSIAILIQHMCGNMYSRWTHFLTSDGEKKSRNRDGEFEETPLSREQLMLNWEGAWDVVLDTISGLKKEDLMKTVYIRKEPHTVLQAIERQLSHYAYHVGQIVYIAKNSIPEDWKTLSMARKKSIQTNT
ncbi:DUF1572 family protein [Longirhabdus pacifica]|uniref:DUF1572 family protein n=1 Tax=Longirhabdus pacifica TaxID=2305227 RepID=UPI001008B6D6|nr:DUF1572 family protein [Longirhabdus pacifica]